VREPIAEPDALIVQDPTLLHQVDVFGGLLSHGYILINSSRGFRELGLGELAERFRGERLLTIPATDLAREHLGRPIPNAALIGGFAALSGLISLDSVTAAIRGKFAGKLGDANAGAAAAAFDLVERRMREPTLA
jgi:pyruvate ferredoxin oxidoreductase gamma subunit